MASLTFFSYSSSSISATLNHPHKTQTPLSLSLSKPTNLPFLSPPPSSLSLKRLSLSCSSSPTEPEVSSSILTEVDLAKGRELINELINVAKESGDDPLYVLRAVKTTVDNFDPEKFQASLDEAKRQEIFAVVMVGGRQYIVIPGRYIYTQRLKGANVNDKIVLNKVLLVGTKNSTYIGRPIVTNAVVHAVVEEQLLDKKKIVFKYKPKKNYRRNIGHRQPITRIKITGITGFEDFPATTLPAEAVV